VRRGIELRQSELHNLAKPYNVNREFFSSAGAFPAGRPAAAFDMPTVHPVITG